MTIKKILTLIISLVLVNISPVQAIENLTCEEMSLCPAIQDVNGPVSSFLSKITGMNTLVTGVLESQIKKQMDKALSSDTKVEIEPFGAKSLLEGKFKKFTASTPYAQVDGIYFSNLTAKSLCDYNHFIYKDGQVYTNENFLMEFSANITSEDLQKIVESEQYQKLLNSMNIKVGNYTVFRVYEPKAEIKENKLVFSIKVISPLTLGQPKLISTTMDMVVSDGKLIFTDIKTTPQLKDTNLNTLLPIINKLNPFTVKLAILNNTDSNLKIKEVYTLEDKINIKGLVIVQKNYYNN